MSGTPPPVNNRRVLTLARLASQLGEQLGGLPLYSISVQTPGGVKVADLAWVKSWKDLPNETPLTSPPPLVVEVLETGAASCSSDYLGAGVVEVVTVAPDENRGQVVYHRSDGPHETSALGLALEPDFE